MGEYVRGYQEAIKDVRDLIDKRESSMKNEKLNTFTDAQHTVLNGLKYIFQEEVKPIEYCICSIGAYLKHFHGKNLVNHMTEKEFAQVIQVLSLWVIEQDEKEDG